MVNWREKARRKLARQMAVEMLAQIRRAEDAVLEQEMRAWRRATGSALQKLYDSPINRQAAKDFQSWDEG